MIAVYKMATILGIHVAVLEANYGISSTIVLMIA